MSRLLPLLPVVLPLVLAAAAAAEVSLFVAPTGSDTAAGTKAAPFATLERARDEVRKLNAAGPRQPISVLLRGGVYPLAATIEFTPADSGTADAPVTYAAAPGERPVISGGRRITGWRRGEGNLWVADIPEVKAGTWYFHQLFVNGARRTRARTPNVGYLYTGDVLAPINRGNPWEAKHPSHHGFVYRNNDLTTWHNPADAMVVIYHSWTTSIHYLDAIDAAAHTVDLAPISTWPIGYWWEYNTRYHVESLREALDAPGEWYLDRQAGTLSYLPMPGEDMQTAEVVAPVVSQTLLAFRGKPEEKQFVQHLAFRGIAFHHADCRIAKDMPTDQQGAVERPATVNADGMRNCLFEDCEIAHAGENGLWLAAGSTDNVIRHCRIYDLGGGAVYIGPHAYKDVPELLVQRNTVENCWLHHGSLVFRGSSGVWVGPASYNRVVHNEISDFGHLGISCGWSWGYAASSANHNEIAWNHVHHLCNGLFSDSGGIYHLGVAPGTTIHHNVVHDVIPTPLMVGGTGIYLDEGSSGVVVENNIVYNVGAGGFHQHYGKENIVRNNILAFAGHNPVTCARPEEHLSYTFEHNIVLCDEGQATSDHWSPFRARTAFDHNLYWDVSGKEPAFSGVSWEEWRKSGRDPNSVIADPLFVDAEHRDFRLKPGSPALAIGFQPFDLSAVGLEGEAAWVNAPKRLPREPLPAIPPPPPPPPPRPYRDGFENDTVGKTPSAWSATPADQPTAIQITDQVVPGGKCLQLTEIEGLKYGWQPHVWYNTRPHTEGKVRFACDLMNSAEHPSVCMVMLRDYSQKQFEYREGPHIEIGEDGTLTGGGKALTHVPLGQWVHLEVLVELSRPGYRLAVTVRGQPERVFDGVAYEHKEFGQIGWVGFSSMGKVGATFVVDDVVLEGVKP
ncbi:MAG: right-handed parallel beta-helix repeat-containing protein [Armatimonadetes bacterium]|nr:right-handed parallel beta-helix repeat-containing protein [Armatimonadota bacterium]